MQPLTWIVIALAAFLAIAWYLSYSAARLDRLHAKVEGALSALDAALVRRAESSIELANSGALDPASALLVADVATLSLARTNARAGEDDLLEGQHFAGREEVESELTDALSAAFSEQSPRGVAAPMGRSAVERLAEASLRVRLARRFHNEAVKEVQRVRDKAVVRLFRLAGHAELPPTVEFHDTISGLDS